jgi:hypothetical protein
VVGVVRGETLEFPGGFPELESKRRCPVAGLVLMDNNK